MARPHVRPITSGIWEWNTGISVLFFFFLNSLLIYNIPKNDVSKYTRHFHMTLLIISRYLECPFPLLCLYNSLSSPAQVSPVSWAFPAALFQTEFIILLWRGYIITLPTVWPMSASYHSEWTALWLSSWAVRPLKAEAGPRFSQSLPSIVPLT